MREYSIRQANTADAVTIARIHIDVWRTTYNGFVDPDVLAGFSYETRADRWRQWLGDESSIVLVAEMNDSHEILGFCQSGAARESDPRFNSEIYAIYILDEHHRKGIGRELVRQTASILASRGYTSIMAWVLADNPAVKFYEALGGKIIRKRGISIGRTDLEEIAYGWNDLKALL